jgi:glutathione S-transferase
VLFPDASSRSLGFFLDQWTDTELIPIIRELFRPLFYLLLDAEGRAYYLAVKNGPPAAAPALVSRQIRALDDPNAVAHLGAAGRAKLQIFENLLAKTDGPFVLGAKASHADSAVFGWYVSSQVNAETVNRELWQHASLPNIARWAKAMEKATKFVSPFSTKLTAELKDEALKELEK